MLARSSASSLGRRREQRVEDLLELGLGGARRLSASTFASFQRRAPAAVDASAHSAARTPGTLLAAIEAPVPVQQHTTPCSARPSATSRAAASDAQAQSLALLALGERPVRDAPRGRGAQRVGELRAPTPVTSSLAIEIAHRRERASALAATRAALARRVRGDSGAGAPRR